MKTYIEDSEKAYGAAILHDDGSVELFGVWEPDDAVRPDWYREKWFRLPSAANNGMSYTEKENATDADIKKIRKDFGKGEIIKPPEVKHTKSSEYIIDQGQLGADNNETNGVIHFNGDMVDIVGNEEFINQWDNYFNSQDSGWDIHLKEEDPLASLFAQQSYANASLIEKDDFTKNKASILANGGMEIVRWSLTP